MSGSASLESLSKIWEEISTEGELAAGIEKNEILVVEFIVTWSPYFIKEKDRKNLASQNPNVVFRQINIENEHMKKKIKRFRVLCSPTFLIFYKGGSIAKVIGANVGNTDKRVTLKIGRQRMLSQKMTKEMLFFALGKTKCMDNLRDTVNEFDRVLKGLRHGDNLLPKCIYSDICDQLKKVEDIWAVYKDLLETVMKNGRVEDTDVNKAFNLNVPLLTEMNTAVKMWVTKC